MTDPIMKVYLTLYATPLQFKLVVKNGKPQLISDDDFLSGDTSIGLWEINYTSGTIGDGYLATHYLYNRKYDVSIVNDNGIASLINGLPEIPKQLISFKLLEMEGIYSTWLLSDPYNQNIHMTKNASGDVIFIDAPANVCTWIQSPIK